MKKLDPYSAEGLQRMTTLLEEIQEQSDRGAAIVAVAWIEESITAALECFLHADPNSWKRLFAGSGPLANFSSKIDLSRLLGLVTDTIRSDLHIIREIRNEFAHQVAHKTNHTKLAFTTTHINDKCLALKCVAHEKHTDPRTAFLRACAVLYADFEMIQFFGAKVSDGGHIFARVERE
jgi:DNA-binding MltR family transcriptional regulator